MADCAAGAPYYYADLLKNGEFDRWTYESNKRREPNDEKLVLNNRRVSCAENTCSSKRIDVGKKVNQIVEKEQSSPTVVDTCEKNSTVHSTMAAAPFSSHKPLDDKNIYNAELFQDKLCKIRRRCKSPESLNDNGFVSFAVRSACSDFLCSAEEAKDRLSACSADASADTQKQITPQDCRDMRITTSVTAKCPFAEDNLWRETLRKTNLRHARSLDDLDKDNKSLSAGSMAATTMVMEAPTKCGRQSADILSRNTRQCCFTKLSRDVTYVNDCVSAQMRKAKQNAKEYTEDYREIRKIKCHPRVPVNGSDSFLDDDTHYERLDPRARLMQSGFGYHSAERTTPSTSNTTKQHGKNNTQPKTGAQSFLEKGVYPTKPPSFEIDREKLRQWDLMSSAPVAMLSAIQRYPTTEAQTYQMGRNAIRTALSAENVPPNLPGSFGFCLIS